ncbi:hypothetical protein PTSG_04794 [Salpingoeca rosetta]|uniref:Uncharacterized protein n=1 Tax=Salpingoeca rosetta (strain ATCC 50818 / BSB-021) TaxID=946362 RepID=F2U9Q2_SALR5|nr:uncharacterized protein PTSG_04794 [Salpingoeca rosetta]EGD73079.1 hypothetical protein PTSG_04794 [Salpingoeca rosetta]|eukprot:XP_004994110.1 hypothetical protein PTSG_04794 [Salpingoeca rosetta]
MDHDPFFASSDSRRSKRWAPTDGGQPISKRGKGGKRRQRDEEIPSDDEGDDGSGLTLDAEIQQAFADDDDDDLSEDETLVQETAAEKRLRMAKEIIEQIEEQEKEKELEGDMLTKAISHRLRQEVHKQKGVLRRQLAHTLRHKAVDPAATVTTRGHRLPVTSAVISADTRYVVTASKDGSIIKWMRDSGTRLHTWKRKSKNNPTGHTGHVLALALNTDGTFLASAGTDAIINIWDFQTHSHVKYLRGHRGNINGLAFRLGENTLFSACDDRTVKVWNIDSLSYVETLFGHQDQVLAVDSLHRERAVSVGGRDRSLRLWKIVESSQLVFASTGISLDCIAMVTELHFLTGNQNGALSLWDIGKRKPVCTVPRAHGKDSWITAVAAVPYSDLTASGSNNGCIRLWSTDARSARISPVMSINAVGWVNSLKFTADGAFLVAALGKEPRLGRWDCVADAKNETRVFSLAATSLVKEDDVKAEGTARRGDNGAKMNGHAGKKGKPVAVREEKEEASGRDFAAAVMKATSLASDFDGAHTDVPALSLPPVKDEDEDEKDEDDDETEDEEEEEKAGDDTSDAVNAAEGGVEEKKEEVEEGDGAENQGSTAAEDAESNKQEGKGKSARKQQNVLLTPTRRSSRLRNKRAPR